MTRVPLLFDAPRIWESLLTYERVIERPRWPLRLLLPVPVAVEGPMTEVGDLARCAYSRGWFVKRITTVDAPSHYAFDVIEQHLRVAGGLRLVGGSYEIIPVDTTCVLQVSTRYVPVRKPRALWRPLEACVIHAFHRYLARQIAVAATADPLRRRAAR